MHLESLRDAAGRVIPTDFCRCGRPKLAHHPFCCSACRQGTESVGHMSGCNMRCATMGVRGFGVKASDGAELTVREQPERAAWRVTEAEAATMRVLVGKFGYSCRKAARTLGVSHQTVSAHTRDIAKGWRG